MLERKRLAYGDGMIARPKILKSLVFSATFLATMTACSPATNAIPRRDPVLEEARRAAAPPPGERTVLGCFPEMNSIIMERDERITERICRGNQEFILTDRSLYIRARSDERERLGDAEITLNNYYSRTDMRQIIARGIVDWEITESACYFLTRDRKLTVMTNEEMGDTIPEFELPFVTANIPRNRMIFHSGFLFIAPLSGNAIVMSFGDQPDSMSIPLGSPNARDGFFVRESRLFFGRKGIEEREIRINSAAVADVTVAR